MARIELATSPLPRECSATELHGQAPSCQKMPLQTINLESALQNYQITINNNFSRLFTCFQTRYRESGGAGEGNRTLVVSLEGFCSTIELHPPLGIALDQSKIITFQWINHCHLPSIIVRHFPHYGRRGSRCVHGEKPVKSAVSDN